MSKRKQSAELAIMSLWATLGDEGKRIVGDWIHSQRAVKGEAATASRKKRSDTGTTRKGADHANEPPTD